MVHGSRLQSNGRARWQQVAETVFDLGETSSTGNADRPSSMLYRNPDFVLRRSAGLGYLRKVRLNVRPEITVFSLSRAA
ncbi:MAG: hypothetical protein O2945_12310 [Planctomycetota bacterium]|nr:hypothetical protein [Planctomycetota bacterium]MDA0919843.1 hypothetical protein [Planctomycetota bacterium]